MSAEPLSREERSEALEAAAEWQRFPRPYVTETILRFQATVEYVQAKLADCERRERAAVERAERLREALSYYASRSGAYMAQSALAADDEARAT